ncbi:DUF6941 family protein [Azospirillum brasilense]|uniref:DUF6941 family protein n=1 Tax=Azospirillum brasilense TaxID=192 RepID=UPI0011A1F18E|nr:hypothetical protein [Azospirillum brasilense]
MVSSQPSQPRYAHTIFCDDVRYETSGKAIIIGVYSSDMFVSGDVPITLPRLLILCEVVSPIEDPVKRLKIRAFGPPLGQEEPEAEIPDIPLPIAPDGREFVASVVRVAIDLAPFTVHAEGFIEVTVETERETMRAGRLYIHFLPSPEVSQI